MIRVQIKDRKGNTLFKGSYHMMDSAIEAMGSFDRVSNKCLQCKEYIMPDVNYCSGICQRLSFDEIKK